MIKNAIKALGITTLILGNIIFTANAADYQTPQISTNLNQNNYVSSGNWSNTVKSYIRNNADGTISRIEYNGNNIYVENYDSNFQFKKGFTVPMELKVFGGFYEDDNYFFIVFGQNNNSEESNKEVYRVVKYDKSFNKLDSTSIYGGESFTVNPFEAGSLQMAECDNKLIVHTCRIMLKSQDGLNHQSNYMFSVNIDDMTTEIPEGRFGSPLYVSHSFNQFVLDDGDDIVTLDQGDAYPRAVTLQKVNENSITDSYSKDKERISILDIKGDIGQNYTGVSLGGFEKSKKNYITVGTTVPQNDNFKNYRTREGSTNPVSNVFLSVVSRDNLDSGNKEFKYITNYGQDAKTVVGTPQLAKINDNTFVVLWSENNGGIIKYVKIDGDGNLLSDIKSFNGDLSDCKPIINGNDLIWYITQNSAPIVYKLDINTMNIQKIDNYNGSNANPKNKYGTVSTTNYVKDMEGNFTGWVKENETWYYYGPGDKKLTGNIPLDGVLYHFDSEGKWLDHGNWPFKGIYYAKDDNYSSIKNGWVEKSDGNVIYLENGRPVSGWKMINGSWYYFDSLNEMSYGTVGFGDGKVYKFDDNGKWLN